MRSQNDGLVSLQNEFSFQARGRRPGSPGIEVRVPKDRDGEREKEKARAAPARPAVVGIPRVERASAAAIKAEEARSLAFSACVMVSPLISFLFARSEKQRLLRLQNTNLNRFCSVLLCMFLLFGVFVIAMLLR